MTAAETFSDVEAISVLLGTESFLLAILAAVTALMSNGLGRTPDMPVKAPTLAMWAAGVIAVVAFGALSSWCSLFLGGELRPFSQFIVSLSLLVAIVTQPVFAFFVARGLRSK